MYLLLAVTGAWKLRRNLFLTRSKTRRGFLFFFLQFVSSVSNQRIRERRREEEETQKLKVHEKEEIGGSMEDVNDYTIIKEGEAEILMHAKNEVFYNKTQVQKSFLFVIFLLKTGFSGRLFLGLCLMLCCMNWNFEYMVLCSFFFG